MQSDKLHLLGKFWHIFLAGCGVFALPGLVSAQLDEGAAEPPGENNRYTVELIVFEYTNPAQAGNEQFLPDELPLDRDPGSTGPLTFGDPGSFSDPDMPVSIDDEAEFLTSDRPTVAEDLAEIPSHIIQTQLEVLDPAEHAMKEIYNKLVASGAHRPIMRTAWTQVTHEKDDTLPITLRRLGNAPLRLDGTVMLYLSRYLHLVVDLTIEAQEEQASNRFGEDAPYYGDRRSATRYGFGYQQQPVPIKYRISEDRIFRNGELRYFDHPKFGVLARVTRVEEEVPETDEMFLLPAENAGAQ